MPFADPESTDEAVYRVVEAVPSGRCVSYSTIAAVLGLATPRRPAAALRRAPEGLTWWRVTRADGSLPASLVVRAVAAWDAEGTPRRDGGVQRGALWEPNASELAVIEASVAELRIG